MPKKASPNLSPALLFPHYRPPHQFLDLLPPSLPPPLPRQAPRPMMSSPPLVAGVLDANHTRRTDDLPLMRRFVNESEADGDGLRGAVERVGLPLDAPVRTE